MSISKAKLRETITAYAFMIPALIFVVIFVFVPIIFSLPLAFMDYSVLGKTRFIGLDNFKEAFGDDVFWASIRNSMLFILVVPPIQILSILLAVLVNKKIRGITFFRVLFYIPVVTSMVAVSIIWKFLFDPDGVINTVLLNLGVIHKAIYFLTDAHTALFAMMFITIWQGLGYYMMLYLAGLQSISGDVIEAARIDGASAAIILFKIRIPLLKPYVWFCSLTSIISAINVFDIVYVMSQGTVSNATVVTNYYSYFKAFNDYRFGYSSAVGLLLSVITMVFSIIVFAYGRKGGMNNDE